MSDLLSILLFTLILVLEIALLLDAYMADQGQKRDAARTIPRRRRRQSSMAARGLQIHPPPTVMPSSQ